MLHANVRRYNKKILEESMGDYVDEHDSGEVDENSNNEIVKIQQMKRPKSYLR